nr:MAG TPA: Major capsid protein [Caudoviricetes sp.]
MKRLVMKLMIALLVNAIVGGLIALAVGVAPWIGAVALNVIAIAVGTCLPKDVLRAGVFTEVWTGELVKSLRGGLEGSWLDGVPDQSTIVINDVIHLVEVGVDPDVLINNTTYPIPSQALNDKDIAVKLDKFQTKVTPITDDELYAASYDKMARVKESHGNSINDSKFTKAAHALCAQENTAKTPVLKTTGERDAETGRLRLTMADLVALKAAMDKLHVPAENRRLVLCSDHVNDLLLVSQTFREQYNIDRATGKVGKLFGFDVYEYANTPLYTQAGKKKNLGVAAGAGEFNCSFAFYTPRVFKATGSTKMYYSEAATDPEYQRNKINFRHYFLCMPKLADAGVVMMSGYKAS